MDSRWVSWGQRIPGADSEGHSAPETRGDEGPVRGQGMGAAGRADRAAKEELTQQGHWVRAESLSELVAELMG